jgi:putative acetyltransferase
MKINIRPYVPSDWPAICRIHDLARPLEVQGFMPSATAWAMEKVAHEEKFFDSQTFVATRHNADNDILGFISIAPPEITWCYVDPAHHRQGIGKSLIHHVMPLVGEDAFVVCIAQNPQAVAFYRSFGLIPAAIFPGEAQSYPCTCVRLTLLTSKHRHRPPTPSKAALRLAGFSEQSPGAAVKDSQGVYHWR